MNTPRVTQNSGVVKRQYRSTLRTAQARETRRAIVAAATRLFVEDGFGPTTTDAVAAAAGVSRKTVFTAVGSKVDLLKLAIDWAIAGDDELVALADRPEIRRLLRQSDPVALLRGWAHTLVEIDDRVAALLNALEIAADSDPAARSLLSEFRRQRVEGARMIVDRLADLNALSDNVSRDEATDIAWLSSDPAVYDRLVHQRGWRRARFAQWLAEGLIRQLIT
jgi:AcrR family transcriptional regulator